MYGIKASLDLASLKLCRSQFETHLKSMQQLANKNVIQVKVGNMNNQLNQTTSGLSNMNTQAKSFGSNMQYAIGRVAQFAIGMTVVYGAVRLVKEGIQEIADINKADVNIAMITNTDVADVEKLNAGYLEMAQNLKVVSSEVMSGAEAFMRAGQSFEDANKNLETSTKLSKIAGVGNKEMADSLITIGNQYKLNSTELEAYASKVALLDNTSATSSEKINSAMQYSAETFKATGVDMDTALSFITNYSEKSAQSGETIGRAFKSALLNFQKMKLGYNSGDEEEIGAVNKLETLLNSKGIALRKNKDEWNNLGDVIVKIQQNMGQFTEVQKSQLSFLIGGKEQAELTMSTLNNMDRINELKNKIQADDGAQALNESYSKYLTSIEAKKAELKNTLTELWTKTITSDSLKDAISGLTEVVKVTEFLITDSKALIATYIGLILVIKNFGALKFAIGEVTAFMALLKTEGAETLLLLNFNPVILAITALTAVIGVVVYEQYKHSEQVKELKTEYEGLSKAMAEMDGKGIVENTTKLKEQQKELEKLAQLALVKTDLGYGVKDDSGQRNLDKFVKTLEEAGFHVDLAKNKIVELGVAESKLGTSTNITAIQDKTNLTIEEANETQSLIGQYQSLAQEENKSADKKKLLSGLSQQLVGRVNGLTTSVDKNGNMVITNTDLLGGQVDALEVLKQQSTLTANTEIQNAIATAQYMSEGTMQTLDDMKKKLQGYQMLSSALANTDAGKSGFFDAQITGLDMGVTNMTSSISAIEALKSKFAMKAPTLSSSSTTGSGGYMADDTKDAKDATDGLTDAQKRLASATKQANNSVKDYDTSMSKLNILMKVQDNSLENLNKNSKEYRDGLQAKAKLIQQEITLTEKSIKINEANAKLLMSMEGSTSSSSSSSAGSTYNGTGAYKGNYANGLYADWINEAGAKFGISPTLLAGMIQTESGFNAKAVNKSSGATGLAQFLSSTAKDEGLADRTDPETSIFAMAKYLKKRIGWSGSVKGGVKGYGEGTEAYYNKVMANVPNSSGSSYVSSGVSSVDSSTTDGGSDGILSKIETEKASLIDMQKELLSIPYQIFESVTGEFDDRMSAYEKRINVINNEINNTSDGKVKANYSKDIIVALNKEITIARDKEAYIRREIANRKYTSAQVTEMNSLLQDTLQTESDISASIKSEYDNRISIIQSAEAKVTEIIQKQVEQKKQNIEDDNDAEKKAITEKYESEKKLIADRYDTEKKAIADAYDATKKSIEDTKALYNSGNTTDDYNKNLKKEQSKMSDINAEITSASRDTSFSGQARLKTLNDEKLAQQDVIDAMVLQRGRDLNNENFDAELKKIDEQNTATNKTLDTNHDNQTTGLDEQNDLNNKNLDTKKETDLKNLDTKYSNSNIAQMAKDAVLSNKIKTSTGEVISLTVAYQDFENKFGEGLSAMGASIKQNVVGTLTQACNLIKLMNAEGTLNIKVSGTNIPSHKDGKDRIPYDNYLANLHKDEAVLTAEEATDWRKIKSMKILNNLDNFPVGISQSKLSNFSIPKMNSVDMSSVGSNSSSDINFNQPLISVAGNVSENMIPQLNAMADNIKNTITKAIRKEQNLNGHILH